MGGLEKGESPLTMASAYGAFANDGKRYDPHLITKIVDSQGTVIVDNSDPKAEQVVSKETAKEMTSMLLGTFSNGMRNAGTALWIYCGGKNRNHRNQF